MTGCCMQLLVAVPALALLSTQSTEFLGMELTSACTVSRLYGSWSVLVHDSMSA